MTDTVRRLFVEKRPGFAVQARQLYDDLRENLGLPGLTGVRILHRYDIAGLADAAYAQARDTIFAEPPVDVVYEETCPVAPGDQVFAVEYLPGQYDQRADSAAQCVQIITQQEPPLIRTARVIILEGHISPEELAQVKRYVINPVDSREASLDKPTTLAEPAPVPEDVPVLHGFTALSPAALADLHRELGLAMSLEDLQFIQTHFRKQVRRDPTITEIRVIDTYWSDHCRHTTFRAAIDSVTIPTERYTAPVAAAYREYRQGRAAVYGQTPPAECLMDIAMLAMKEMRRQGLLDDLDVSDEINACSIVVEAEVNGRREPWLVMFKNETHNHPTEIEPFGGAATCLGGAIRDPLSGRAYVYQAMRISGSGDPRTPVSETLPGKLPQRKITTGAAVGFSSYGNQVGLATGQVHEFYDPAFVAKRMEVGAVIGAAPQANVVRRRPAPGDVVLLLGGRTGRDGIGGATGASKAHTTRSLTTAAAEVQKGNAPTERKLQRLFRHPQASRLIKKCNDFGAGGVSVAIGELTDGVLINLDAVPKKYEGLDGTELAISESQERMAVVVAREDVPAFMALARQENLAATAVAEVTDDRHLRMVWRGRTIVDLGRDFLDTNGVRQRAAVAVTPPAEPSFFAALPSPVARAWPDVTAAWLANLADLNVCSQRGLTETFDSTIGAATVLMPYGGRCQATPQEGMVAKLPVLEGETTTATAMTFGYHPGLAKWSPFHGALYAVVAAVSKIAALGGDWQRVRLSLQEYFPKPGAAPERWGLPFAALLGAYCAQKRLGIPAIGGKDSMSGTFQDLDVPPTLVAFAVAVLDARRVVSAEFKQADDVVVLLPLQRDEQEMPDFAALRRQLSLVRALNRDGLVRAAATVQAGGVAAAVSKMCFGNHLGLRFDAAMTAQELFAPAFGSLVLELPADVDVARLCAAVPYRLLGRVTAEPAIYINDSTIDLDTARRVWERPLAGTFPVSAPPPTAGTPPLLESCRRGVVRRSAPCVKPRVLIPVFPGTNCEYDSARAFAQAGAVVDTLVFRNLTAADVEESLAALAAHIDRAQIVMLPGGFSAGDEPDGSGKFIAAVFRHPRVADAVMRLLQQRDGLMLGICNGFQALIKLGLVPYGEIRALTADSPTLTYNHIGRHMSRLVRTRVVSTLSPWLSLTRVGAVHTVPVSHGEGRFVAPPSLVAELHARGQIATQYVDAVGQPTYDMPHNPNGSLAAVEAITSPDGRVLGKMAHSERVGPYVAVNVPGEREQGLFAAGVNYFR